MKSATDRLRQRIGIPLVRFGKSFFFEYETPRLLTMHTRRIGIMYRFIQLLLLVYVVAYVFIVMKSYQTFDSVNSSVVTKVKGVLSYNNGGVRNIWDSTDFVVPAQESGAFFVATNLLLTRNQSHGICPEDINVGTVGIDCTSDAQCPANEPTPYGNGIRTGRCVQHTGTCEISGWCPTETDSTPRTATLTGHDTVTILVKNHIVFPNFGVKRRNILKHFSQQYLQSCRYHPLTDATCPIFNLLDIVRLANESMETLAIRGGVIGFHIDWNCNLDHGEEACIPSYSFRRLDNRNDKIAKGWNFRHAYYYYDSDEVNRRDLIKYWGIRFVFLVGGQAGKFSVVDFALHLGSSLGLLGLASAMCEIILSYYASNTVQRLKVERVEDISANKEKSPRISKFPPRSYSVDREPGQLVSLDDGTGYRYRNGSFGERSIHSTVVTPMSQRHLLTSLGSSRSLHSNTYNSIRPIRNDLSLTAIPLWV